MASPIAGIWLGTLHAGGSSLRLQLRIDTGNGGSLRCTLDSIDQKAFGIPCSDVKVSGDAASLAVPAVRGGWSGSISSDGKILTGTWTQVGPGSMPLTLERQQHAIEAPASAAPMPAIPPVPIDQIKSLLDKELADALAKGLLAPATHAGVTVGIVQHGQKLVFSYGTAKDDSVYEIGSITKTFTSLILAQMVEQNKVRLDEPVRELLPPGTVAKPAGAEITLIDISTQHSGLPRMPDNFHPAHPDNPYADYDAKLLYEYIGKQGVAKPANPPFLYSNLAVGLLGQALANRAGQPYPALLKAEVIGPLGMKDTAITLTPSLQARFIQGYATPQQPAHAWDLDALAGAGGIRSTAADMLLYLQAQLHPDQLPPPTLAAANGKTLPAALAMTHEVRAEVGDGVHIAMNWFHVDATGSYWHNGGTGGFSSYALFNPEKDFGVVVLNNYAPGDNSIADKLGLHIAQRLTGLPAVSLAP
ncbi:serine hydrolase domain-containing protein [Silvibacterium sp.]|uniref:serine hydrolase domain-containing protein n=1 Tax=Silvibacterium sp. TaxID=1964179 RepID=UPI0039E5E96B